MGYGPLVLRRPGKSVVDSKISLDGDRSRRMKPDNPNDDGNYLFPSAMDPVVALQYRQHGVGVSDISLRP